MQIKTRDLSFKVAYLIGVKDEHLQYYKDEYKNKLAELQKNREASVIRALSRLRTALMLNFSKTDKKMKFELKNLSSIDWFDKKDLQYLSDNGIMIEQANYTAAKYLMDLSKYINDNISKCESLFYDWQRFDLIKKLFTIPKYNKDEVLKRESVSFSINRKKYPYQMYVYGLPDDCGNLLYDDERLLQSLMIQNGEEYVPTSNTVDANYETKDKIYKYIDDSTHIVVVVDCENSDAFKFMGVLTSLDPDETKKISKIILFDDVHADIGWDFVCNHINIPVEHINVERIVERKSLVDMRLAVEVSKLHYTGSIDSFIILSSDSDYWGLISSLPNANFLVMYERAKCGQKIKDVLDKNGYSYCSIDDFCTGSVEEFRNSILLSIIKKKIDKIVPIDLETMINEAYTETRIIVSDKERKLFEQKCLKHLKLVVTENSVCKIEFQI